VGSFLVFVKLPLLFSDTINFIDSDSSCFYYVQLLLLIYGLINFLCDYETQRTLRHNWLVNRAVGMFAIDAWWACCVYVVFLMLPSLIGMHLVLEKRLLMIRGLSDNVGSRMVSWVKKRFFYFMHILIPYTFLINFVKFCAVVFKIFFKWL
jgi:hypothetical protein